MREKELEERLQKKWAHLKDKGVEETLKWIEKKIQKLKLLFGRNNKLDLETLIPLGSHRHAGQRRNNVPFKLTPQEGKSLVRLARKAVEEYLKNGKIIAVTKDVSPKLMERCGVFVTLNSFHQGKKGLRGCIGFPYPTTALARAVIESAINSATQDPRFPPVSLNELDEIVFEVSVLTPPQLVKVKKPAEYPSKIEVGQDGLIVERSYCKGLLLPQVPIEWKWEEEEFLCQCCMKAGLSPDCWLLEGTKIYKFQAIIFEEVSPKGNIELKKL